MLGQFLSPALKKWAASPQKAKHRIIIGPSNSTLRHIPKELKAETQTDICMPITMATLFTIAKCETTRSIHQVMNG